MSGSYFLNGFILEKCGNFGEKRPFFRAGMAGLGKYNTGGYGRIGVDNMMGRGTGVTKKGNSWVRNPPHPPDRVKLFMPPFQRMEMCPPPPPVWLKLQAPVFKVHQFFSFMGKTFLSHIVVGTQTSLAPLLYCRPPPPPPSLPVINDRSLKVHGIEVTVCKQN